MNNSTKTEVEVFLKRYETATNSHAFGNVRRLLLGEATYFFSDGTYRGVDEIEKAFLSTWSKIQEEVYSITDIEWISIDQFSATCTYRFHWAGKIDGKLHQGEGRGTNILIKQNGNWYVSHEHLSSL